MCSQTFIGRDIRAAVWGICVLAAVAAKDDLRFPFDRQIRDFVSAQRVHFDAAWAAILEAARSSDDIMWIAEGQAPWSGDPNKYPNVVLLSDICSDLRWADS